MRFDGQGVAPILRVERCPAAQNRPYSGGYVLDRHGAPERGIHALQVEVCRADIS